VVRHNQSCTPLLRLLTSAVSSTSPAVQTTSNARARARRELKLSPDAVITRRPTASSPSVRPDPDHHGDDTDHDHGDRGVGAREMEILVREEEADHAHDGQDTHVHRKDGSGVDRAGRDPRHEAGALPLELPGPRVPDGAAWHSADLE